MNDELENALTWFRAAPTNWLKSAKKDLSAAAEWIWGVIQGDFNENATTAQTVTSTAVSMIPFVDQICDVRDVVANCKKINDEPSQSWHWVALVLTLIGLFPFLGSFFKGCGKVMFASMRKAAHSTGAVAATGRIVEASVKNLNKFLERPEVRKTLKALKIDNPYKYLSVKLRELAGQINTAKLVQAFDSAKDAATSLLKLVQKWGGDALATKAGGLLKTIDGVRRRLDQKLGEAIRPVQDMIERLARRLDVEADMAHRAHLKTVNPHGFIRMSEDAERAVFEKDMPSWADKTAKKTYEAVETAPVPPPGWTSTVPDPSRGWHPLDNAHRTFHTIDPKIIPPGTMLYRVVDPKSGDNAICWMSETEFRALRSKADWRRRFAVWANWNSNGEYVTYLVPPGPGLHAWVGPAASQKMDKAKVTLLGGAEQIVIDPAELVKTNIGKRKPTNWGYDNFGEDVSLIGVPTLTNNWF
jgi:hypothetical protein